jgi:hypothetical protein
VPLRAPASADHTRGPASGQRSPLGRRPRRRPASGGWWRRPRSDVASGDPELVGQEADQCHVRRPVDRRCHDPTLSTPSTTSSTRSTADRGVRRTAKRTLRSSSRQKARRACGLPPRSSHVRSLPAEGRSASRGGLGVRVRPGPRGCAAAPRRAPRPTPTSVAPSSIAISKSSLMPIDRAGPSSGHCPRRRSEVARRSRNVVRASAGSGGQAPDRHQARDSRCGSARTRHGGSSRLGAKPALAGSRSTLTWTGPGSAARARPRDEPVEPRGELDRVDRLDGSKTSSAGAPCSTAAADEVPAGAGHLGHLAAASWTRFSPRRSSPARHASRSARPRRSSRPRRASPRPGAAGPAQARGDPLEDLAPRGARYAARVRVRSRSSSTAGVAPARVTSGGGKLGDLPGRPRR